MVNYGNQIIGISHYWVPEYGYDDLENNYLNFLKTKLFVICCSAGYGDTDINNEYEDLWSPKDVMNDYLTYKDKYSESPYDDIVPPIHLELVIGKCYCYNERMFMRKNAPFYHFLAKCKKYYSHKLANYKNPQTIMGKMITGRPQIYRLGRFTI